MREEKRLADVTSSFDRFDDRSEYVLTWVEDQLVGTIKIVKDSEIGLPCEEVKSVQELRERGNVVEFGHFMTSPKWRRPAMVTQLVRYAIGYASKHLGARFIAADMFFDGETLKGFEHHFYSKIGGVPLHGPYRDTRFLNAPTSLIGYIDTHTLVHLAESSRGARKRLCQFLAGDMVI